MRFSKILCPVDFSPGSQQALRVATRLANEANAELVVVHAWYVPAIAYSEFTFPADAIQGMADDANRALETTIAEAKRAGAKQISGKLLTGEPWSRIVGELDEHGYDLCVIGTHGRTGLARVLLGSVAEKVVRHSPCSVLAVRPEGEVKPFKHPLVPTDFSASAEHALEMAVELAPEAITLLHVIELPVATGRTAVPNLERSLDESAMIALAEAANRLGGKARGSITTRTRIGYPGAQTLAELDDDRSIDLVVMGTHGRTGVARALLGSVAEKVVRHARCPVLVARKVRS
ncbi:MAG TPA: universal stress protein [Kofleriaceae bacterium]|nr:universal stress protein [Kofleriaceae bacterium]